MLFIKAFCGFFQVYLSGMYIVEFNYLSNNSYAHELDISLGLQITRAIYTLSPNIVAQLPWQSNGDKVNGQHDLPRATCFLMNLADFVETQKKTSCLLNWTKTKGHLEYLNLDK